MKSFNLLDEPWIPCVRADGACFDLGLAQVIDQAHELREVYEDSPLVTVALHRLLLAVLHRAYGGPRRKADWRALWEVGRFDTSVVGGYLQQWAPRFDLLHPERPFYQCRDAEILEAKLHPASALRQELASGNNATLFDHGRIARFSLAEAARALVAVQQFALGGGVSKPFNCVMRRSSPASWSTCAGKRSFRR
ncbi:MAG: type I-E CRISPR-associated protein Cse1/CasA [Candidatus Competibacteraceae bacterium]|nr:type I-E CRISPR-associated protein Cse1/CasA [Candidatus Competibacteraceae bacterium]